MRATRSFLSCVLSGVIWLLFHSEAKNLCQSSCHHDMVCVHIVFFGFQVLNKKFVCEVFFSNVSMCYSTSVRHFRREAKRSIGQWMYLSVTPILKTTLNVISVLKQNPFASGKFSFCPLYISWMKESCLYYHSKRLPKRI